MARYISVESTIDDLHTVDPQYQKVVDWCIRVIEAQPTADVVPVRHGRWERDEMTGFYICSVCDNGYEEQPTLMGKPMFDYCPVCGAKMGGGDGDD